MIDAKLASRIESMGYVSRELRDARESNPYLPDRKTSARLGDPFTDEFIEAWWRGWDRDDAMLKLTDR